MSCSRAIWSEPGCLLWARFGKGTFVYTGLAFFRQLPAGVPGAFRLFANLLAGVAPPSLAPIRLSLGEPQHAMPAECEKYLAELLLP